MPHHGGLRPPNAVVDEAFPDAEKMRVVLNNLNTRRTASLYQAFPPEEARRIGTRLEFHYILSIAAG